MKYQTVPPVGPKNSSSDFDFLSSARAAAALRHSSKMAVSTAGSSLASMEREMPVVCKVPPLSGGGGLGVKLER